MQRLGEVQPVGLRERLAAAAAVIQRNLIMVRLRDDLDCEVAAEHCAMREPVWEKLRQLYAHWGFKGMLAALEEAAPNGQQVLI